MTTEKEQTLPEKGERKPSMRVYDNAVVLRTHNRRLECVANDIGCFTLIATRVTGHISENAKLATNMSVTKRAGITVLTAIQFFTPEGVEWIAELFMTLKIHRPELIERQKMLHTEQNVQECDTTGLNSSNEAQEK